MIFQGEFCMKLIPLKNKKNYVFDINYNWAMQVKNVLNNHLWLRYMNLSCSGHILISLFFYLNGRQISSFISIFLYKHDVVYTR